MEFIEEGELKKNFTVLRMQIKIHAAASDICSLSCGFKAANRKLCYTFSSFYREYGDKSCPPTLAPLVTDAAGKESAEEEEEVEGKEPASSFSPDPLQHVDIGDLSLKECDSCVVPTGKEGLGENGAAEMAADAIAEVQQEAEDSRTPQGIFVYKRNQAVPLGSAAAHTPLQSTGGPGQQERGRGNALCSERTERCAQTDQPLMAGLSSFSLQSKWMRYLTSAFFMP